MKKPDFPIVSLFFGSIFIFLTGKFAKFCSDERHRSVMPDSEDGIVMIFMMLFFAISVGFVIWRLHVWYKKRKEYTFFIEKPKEWMKEQERKRKEEAEIRRQNEILQQVRNRIQQEQLDQEYEDAVRSQNMGSPWSTKYELDPCPYCGHYKVRRATWDDKKTSVAFWGAASSKIACGYKCDRCKEMF